MSDRVVAMPVAETVPSCFGFSVVAVAQRSLDLDASVWWMWQWHRSLASLPQCGGYWSLMVRVAVWWLCLNLRRSLVAPFSVWWLLGDGPWML